MTFRVTRKEYVPAGKASYNTQLQYKSVTMPWSWFNPEGSPYWYQVPEMTIPQLLASAPSLGYLVPNSNGGWYNDPLWPGGWYTTMPPPILGDFDLSKSSDARYLKKVTTRYLQYLECNNSRNTPGWFGAQGTKSDVLALTKSSPPLRRPKKPILYISRFQSGPRPIQKPRVVLRINPPLPYRGEGSAAFQVRLAGWLHRKSRREERLTAQADRRYRLLLERYDARELRLKLSRERRLKAYKTALDRYVIREAKYQLLLARSKELRYHKASKLSRVHTDNPYWRVKMRFVGPPMLYSYSWRRPWVTSGYVSSAWYYPHAPGYPFGIEPSDISTPMTQTKKYWGIEAGISSSVMDETLTDSELSDYVERVRKHVFDLVNVAVAEYDDKLKRKINQKLKNQTVHIGNIVAERKQTLDLIQSSVKRILGLIKLKRNIFKAAASYAKSPKRIASDILAFKFGVEPLVKDIMSFAKYIDESSDSPVITVRTNLGPKRLPFQVDVPGLKFVGYLKLSYVVKCNVDNPAARTLSEFGLINPLEILWEVAPWSFVVDWFLPVGDWISNKTADCGISFLTGTRSITLEGSFSSNGLQIELSSDPSSNQGQNTDLFRAFFGEMVDRTVLTGIPDLPPIKLKNPWSWSHGVETVALLVQKLKIR